MERRYDCFSNFVAASRSVLVNFAYNRLCVLSGKEESVTNLPPRMPP
jgi:hypothetical protein